MLAGDADRERAADVLKAAYAEGRLRKPEYDDRVGRVMAARTLAELHQLTGDVPHGPGPGPVGPPVAHPATAPGPSWVPGHGLVPPGYGPGYGPPPRPVNAASTGALICGLLVPFTCGASGVPAVILGHKARAEIRRSGERGDGSAVTGLAMGWLGFVLLLLVLVL
ncbi:DUF1707 and DUF4190 domain-containing protein [Streptomyces daliensis]|uniref:DUF1707 and DUF4190 domain-containing protein n=1 Tax=Streptomyces daliensis TaxID=299421 RepID=A0A8T4IT19_9ACTN|nr:DUF1707 and DUF4190 domain-containing protein [Streptomyces daliensis]